MITILEVTIPAKQQSDLQLIFHDFFFLFKECLIILQILKVINADA